MHEHSPALEEVRNLIKAELGYEATQDIIPEASLHTLGIDSLAAVNLVVALAANADVDLDDFIDDLDPPKDIAGLCHLAERFRSVPV